MAESNSTTRSGAFATGQGTGTARWTNPSNALVADGTSASVVPSSGATSENEPLRVTDFGYPNYIPTGAVITGLQFNVLAWIGNGTSGSATISATARKGSLGTSSGYFTSSPLTTTPTYYALGSSTSMWGETWPLSDVNSTSFGVFLRADAYGTGVASSVTNASNAATEGGTVPWTDLAYVYADDANRANQVQTDVAANNAYLNCFAVAFETPVPSNAVINGITVTLNRRRGAGTSGVGNVRDETIQLLKAGTRVGTNKADTAANWPGSDTPVSYGGSADLWGTTWTPADINATNFGVSIRTLSQSSTTTRVSQVNIVQFTVNYTVPGDQTVFVDHVEAVATYSGIVQFSGAVTETLGATASMSRVRLISGTAAMSETMAADLSRLRELGSGTVTEAEALSGTLDRERSLSGSLVEAETLSGAVSRERGLDGTLAEAEALSGSMCRTRGLIGALAETSTHAGTVSRLRALTGTVSISEVLSGVLSRERGLLGEIAETSGYTGALQRLRELVGELNETYDINATLTVGQSTPTELKATVQWQEWQWNGTSFQLTTRTHDVSVLLLVVSEPLTIDAPVMPQ